ncbi:hypothetical protein TEA_001939 [Camellia sinensis var. sinensis]|uniref:Uncharacterized protein n=1 Tax=Camellia sinensis var. sinensis TaxID=542762 RepID=A0A4S4DU55_CAMSN|nr:hypothetical protein TEA_001939 [Camellia sinensis var. sinensis]
MEEWKNENSSRIESKRGHEWLGDDTEVEPCTKKQAKDALSDTELESCANKHELESGCAKKQTKDALSDTELESCANKQVKEASNDEIFSEISNPNLSPTDNACSIQTVSSQLAKLVSNNQVVSGENSSTCSRNLSTEESLNEEEESKNDTSGAVSTSLFVCEIPKDFSSTGIRKIIFKFSKCKEIYDNQLSAIAVGSGSDGISQWNHSASDDMNTEISSYGKILSAYEFELHAGGKTRHPSNHIYLENGKPIYSVIQELKTAPHSVNEESFQAWKESLQENSHMVKTEKRRHISVPGMHFSVRITFVLDEEMSGDDECRETLQGINNNGKLSEGYLMLACDIEVMEPKSSEDIYKTHLLHGRASAGLSVNSTSQNLAATFVNAFLNVGFGHDSALWDVDSGLAQIDKYLHSDDKNVIASASLAVGILTCGVEHECDLIRSKFSRVLEDKKMPLDVIVFTAISLGLVYVGSCDEDISQTIISALKHQNLSKLGQPLTCLLPLGLDLLYLGKQKSVEGTAEISKTLNTKIRTHCDMILFSCAYAGIGDVLKVLTLRLSIRIGVRSVMLMKVADRSFFTQVQYLLGQCAQHLKRGETHQGPTVLRIAMVAMAEELGLEMVIRFEQDYILTFHGPSFYHSSSVMKQTKNCRRSYQEKISPSKFEAHAGCCRNIYTSSGLTLHDIALSLANGQNLATGSSDDMCATCGAGGDLIICDGCPLAFHTDATPFEYVMISPHIDIRVYY